MAFKTYLNERIGIYKDRKKEYKCKTNYLNKKTPTVKTVGEN